MPAKHDGALDRLRYLGHITQSIAITGAGAVLLAGAGWATVQEINPYTTSALTPTQRIAAVTDGARIPGLATTTQQAYLLECIGLMNSFALRFEPDKHKTFLAQTCEKQANALAAASPANSLAWFVGAFAASRLRDVDSTHTRLLRSYLTGSTEQWIAALRVPLAEDHLADLPATLVAHHERDLAIMVASRRGVAAIADRYITKPEFRERITAIVENAPVADQTRFLAYLRQSIANLAGRQP